MAMTRRDEIDSAVAMRLRVPSMTRDMLPRTVVQIGPEELAGVKLVLFRAPSGYGKTVAMTQLRARLIEQGRNCAWFTLGEADNEAGRFLHHLTAAVAQLETAEGLDGAAQAGGSMIDRLGALQAPFALFIDEAETMREDGALDVLRELLQELPENGVLVVGTQRVPQISLARYRLHGQLREFRPTELRFTLDETRDFLVGQQHLRIDPGDLTRLQSKTEGWPAALRMASVALRNQASIPRFIDRFSGSDLAVGEYLTEEFLSDLSPGAWSFLLRTSILSELSSDLCAALCPGLDAGAHLEDLVASGVLITPLDGAGRMFRYHALLAGYLKGQLRRHMPDEIVVLHRRASEWYQAAGRPMQAIDHRLAAGDHDRACAMLGEAGPGLLERGRVQLLARWFACLPDALLDDHPALRVMQAWAVCFTAGPDAAQEIADRPALTACDDPVIRGELRCLRPMILAMAERFTEAEAAGQLAEDGLHLVSAYARNTTRICMANIRATLDRRDPEAPLVQDDQPFSVMYSESVQGIIDLQDNRFLLAKARFRIAASASGDDGRRLNGNVWAGIPYALTLYETGDLAGAAHLLRLQVPFAASVGLGDHLILAGTHLSRIAFDAGDVDEAFELLVRLERFGFQRCLPRVVAGAQLERARLFLRQDNLRAARDQLRQAGDPGLWAGIRPLRLLANDLETLPLGQARLHLHEGDHRAALAILNAEMADAMLHRRPRRALVIRLLSAAAWHQAGDTAQAWAALQKALPVCAREEYQRLLLDEGRPVADVLRAYASGRWKTGALARDARFGTWFEALLALLPAPETGDAPDEAAGLEAPLDPLTPKELQVLHYLAEGYSNAAMSEKLFVSDSTVRTHLRNINSKLGVSSRARAVVAARRMKLIP
ncbi:LuxR C-terminal-related transcriptional regulator [Marinibacterium sp. SX1]|uniref:LuxR C-terminal-related transcriptional regulator n=1 Tax=Marinibacterium sp. SX1 TaxID=3388424 RepID=UPI003D17ADEC